MSHGLPEGTRRLFPHYRNRQAIAATAPELVMARVMEEGDSEDLQWLTARYSESSIRKWFTRHGSRQLTRRSRAFWQTVLNLPPLPVDDNREDLWPL